MDDVDEHGPQLVTRRRHGGPEDGEDQEQHESVEQRGRQKARSVLDDISTPGVCDDGLGLPTFERRGNPTHGRFRATRNPARLE
jgi:hypothetical protein